MATIEHYIMIVCIVFSLYVFYSWIMSGDRLSDEINENYREFRENNLIGDRDEMC